MYCLQVKKKSLFAYYTYFVTIQTYHLSTCQSHLREDLAAMKTISSDPQNHVLLTVTDTGTDMKMCLSKQHVSGF